MKATITNHAAQCARNLHGDKELVATLAAIAREHPGAGSPLRVWAEARIYVSRSNGWGGVVHCSVWIHPQYGADVSGYGRAGGGGYHKASSALGEALRSAGIKLDTDIDGRGAQAMEDAMSAVALAAMGRDHPAGVSILVHSVGV